VPPRGDRAAAASRAVTQLRLHTPPPQRRGTGAGTLVRQPDERPRGCVFAGGQTWPRAQADL